MPSAIYEAGPNGLLVFLALTIVLGGGGAFVSGKSMAETWRPIGQLPFYALLLAIGIRFLHYALFAEPFLSPTSFAVDYVVMMCLAVVGYRMARTRQMATQYGTIGK